MIYLILLSAYIFSILIIRQVFRVGFKQGVFDKEDAEAHLVWFVPVINLIAVIVLVVLIVYDKITEIDGFYTFTKKFLNKDL